MFKFIHCADLHVGDSRRLPDYLGRQRSMLEQIFQLSLDRECDALLICGDVYDKMTTLYEHEKDLFIEVLGKYDSKIPIIIINGQHDIVVETQRTHLSILKELADSGVLKSTYIVEFSPKVIPVGNWDIVAVPFSNYTTIEFSDAVAALMEDVRNPRQAIGMFHGMLKGSFNDHGIQLEGGITLPSTVRYWALGDIHKRQQMNSISWYSGSPIQHNFGELETERGCLCVSVGKKLKVEEVNLTGIKKLVNVDLDDSSSEIPEDALVKVSYTKQEKILNKKLLPDNVVASSSKIIKSKEEDFSFDDGKIECSDILKDVILKLNYSSDIAEKSIGIFNKISDMEG